MVEAEICLQINLSKAIGYWELDHVWSGVKRLVHLNHQPVRGTLLTLKTQLWGENGAKMYSRHGLLIPIIPC